MNVKKSAPTSSIAEKCIEPGQLFRFQVEAIPGV